MPSCKDLLKELSEFLDDAVDPEFKRQLLQHISECPSCEVIVHTTQRTIAVYKHSKEQPVPDDVRARIWSALEKKMAAAQGRKSGIN